MKLCAFLLLAAVSWAQSSAPNTQDSSVPALPDAVLTKLFPPTYPPLARQARISGDVPVAVKVRPDGTVASAEALSGHPMLKPAAVENAMKSEFECKGCAGETPFLLTYTFGTIQDETKYDRFENRPVRAAKCIYLWKCRVVRVNTFDWCLPHDPEITHSPGHVTILDFFPCVETTESMSASR